METRYGMNDNPFLYVYILYVVSFCIGGVIITIRNGIKQTNIRYQMLEKQKELEDLERYLDVKSKKLHEYERKLNSYSESMKNR